MDSNIDLKNIFNKIRQRIFNNKDNNKSYSSFLYNKDLSYIIRKFNEESFEFTERVVESRFVENKKLIIEESCDLLYHMMIILMKNNISIDEIYEELSKRSNKINNLKDSN